MQEYNIYAGTRRVCTNVTAENLERRKDFVRNAYPNEKIIVVLIEEVTVQVYDNKEMRWKRV